MRTAMDEGWAELCDTADSFFHVAGFSTIPWGGGSGEGSTRQLSEQLTPTLVNILHCIFSLGPISKLPVKRVFCFLALVWMMLTTLSASLREEGEGGEGRREEREGGRGRREERGGSEERGEGRQRRLDKGWRLN